jgi:hypothetical protein
MLASGGNLPVWRVGFITMGEAKALGQTEVANFFAMTTTKGRIIT